MKNRLQFSVRTSVLKQFFRNVANPRVAALSPRRRKLGERAPSVFPLSAGGCAATHRLDVTAFNYKFTCQNFDQARGVKEGGGGRAEERNGLSSYWTEQKLQSIFLLEQLRWLPLKPLISRQKGTQRTCLRPPSLTYWVFIPAPWVSTGVRELGRTLELRCARRRSVPLEYISSTLALFSCSSLRKKGRRCSRMLQVIRAWTQLTNTIFLDFFARPLNLWMLPKLVWRN